LTNALAYINNFAEQEMYILIEGCVANDKLCQEKIYKQLYPKMMSMVRRYVNYDQYQTAEEILNNGFLKVFQKIESFKHEGSFEGWVRKIVFHSMSDYIRQNVKYKQKVLLVEKDELIDNNISGKMGYDELIKVIYTLPATSRVVFNMYAIEGFSHREIADQLNISEGTSKWHLFEARKILKQKLQHLEY
jgi:RNA polymerase sigma factor (sigma-70 family)